MNVVVVVLRAFQKLFFDQLFCAVLFCLVDNAQIKIKIMHV